MGSWRISDRFFVRTTGFPFELIELDTAAVAEAVAADEAARATLGEKAGVVHELLGRQREALTSNQRRRLRRQLVGRAPLTLPKDAEASLHDAAQGYNVALAGTLACDVALQRAYQRIRQAARRSLWEAARRGDFLEAVQLLSLGARRTIDRYLAACPDAPPSKETSSTRKAERRIFLYLQRFCTKAETTSFFGPIASGRLDVTEPSAVRVAHGPRRLRNRRTYPAGWLVRAATDRAWQRHREHLPLRRCRDLVTVEGVVYRYVTRDHFSRSLVPLGPSDVVSPILELADGEASAEALRRAHPDEAETLDRLIDAGALTSRPRIPRQARDGLATLAKHLEATLGAKAGAEIAVLRHVSSLIGRLADTPGPERGDAIALLASTVEAAFGIDAFRGAGKHYADRYPFFEDATRDLDEFVLGAPLGSILDRLGPVLDLWLAAKQPAQRFRESRFHQWLDAAFEGAEEVPLARVVERLHRARTDPEEVDDDYLSVSRLYIPDAFPRPLKALLSDNADKRVVDLPDELLAQPVAGNESFLSSADVLMLPPGVDAKGWRCVLGEAHRMVCAFRFFLDGLPDEAAVEASIDAILAEAAGSDRILKVYDSLDAKLSYRYLSPRLIDFDPDDAGPAERPSVSWGDLVFERDQAGWQLRLASAPDDPRPLRFLFGAPREIGGGHTITGVSVNAKGMPPAGVSHTPRVTFEDIIILRETWALKPDLVKALFDGAEPHRAWARFQSLRAERGMPRYLFVRSDSEPKPIWLDAENPVALDNVRTLAAHATGRLIFSEMLPGPEDLWFRDGAGRYVCELRTNLVRPADPEVMP